MKMLAVFWVLLSLGVFLSLGCATALGYLADHKLDDPGYGKLDPLDCWTLSSGEEIRVTLRDGTRLQGKVDSLSFVASAGESDSSTKQDGAPAPGETIQIHFPGEPVREACFLGMEKMNQHGHSVPAIRFQSVGWQLAQVQPLTAITSITRADGRQFHQEEMRAWTPRPGAIVIRSKPAPAIVRLEDVALIERKRVRPTSRFLYVGLLVDALAAYVAISNWKLIEFGS
ncbi:MAG: hypothetical protein KBD56_07830 [Candidatus Eisenbacteria bacterium]|nr:hypothetical protein [Candidatus Eisenbacteria bacterium]